MTGGCGGLRWGSEPAAALSMVPSSSVAGWFDFKGSGWAILKFPRCLPVDRYLVPKYLWLRIEQLGQGAGVSPSHIALGQNPVLLVNIPLPTKID